MYERKKTALQTQISGREHLSLCLAIRFPVYKIQQHQIFGCFMLCIHRIHAQNFGSLHTFYAELYVHVNT